MFKNNKNIVFFIIIIILVITLLIYLFIRINENNIEIGPVFKSMFSDNSFFYKRSIPKKAIKNKAFRKETNAAFKQPPEAPAPPDSLNDLASIDTN
jgi:hypothetical protein